MKSLEQTFSHKLRLSMAGLWLCTRHEDGDVNPGVPDISFVMRNGNYETGWLELKACPARDEGKRLDFKIESSQHQWMADHELLVPCYFLIEVGTVCFLVHGKHHATIANQPYLEKLEAIGIAIKNAEIRAKLPPLLRDATKRR
jgi:hypothetical protein